MGAASGRHAAGQVLCALALTALLTACQPPPTIEPVPRPAPRHPIQQSVPTTGVPAMPVVDPGDGAPRRITPGPNSRISPTPDMAPRVEPSDRLDVPSSRQEVDNLQRELRMQRKRERVEPGPPAGTIDRRPGTIRTTPGTIEFPR